MTARRDRIRKSALGRRSSTKALVTTAALWLAVALTMFTTVPDSFFTVFVFLLLLFFALLFSASLTLASRKRGVIIASILTAFLIFRIIGLGNLTNFLLLVGVGIAAEFYMRRQR